jgi:hypothetical protein
MIKTIYQLISKFKDSFLVTFLIILSAFHLVYAIRTNLYFSVDDFVVLAYFKSQSLGSIFLTFIQNGDIFGFRKIFGYEVLKIIFDLFKVNPLPYILINHLLQVANLLLLFFIIKINTKNSWFAFFCSLIFNKIYLFYFSNIHEYLGCFFCLLSIFLFLKYPKQIYFALSVFILALLTKELAFSLPFILLALSLIRGITPKKTVPFFFVLGMYAIYQAFFIFSGRSLPQNASYQLAVSLKQIVSGLLFYFPVTVLLLIGFLIILQKKWQTLWLMVSILITVLPILLLFNRHEPYYLYIPFAYLMILLSLLLPKLNIKTWILYVLIIFVFGGRRVFPIIARQNFPNWQRVSIENVIARVQTSLTNNPEVLSVSLKDINLERDARLMLQGGTLDLFMPQNLSSKYVFSYNEGGNVIEIKAKD